MRAQLYFLAAGLLISSELVKARDPPKMSTFDQDLDSPRSDEGSVSLPERRIQEELIGDLVSDQQSSTQKAFSKIFSTLDGTRSYNKINSFLVERVESDEQEANMVKAIEMMIWEMRKNTFMGQPLVDALKQFTAMAKTRGSESCNKESYAILLKNDRATEGKARRINSRLVMARRIDKLVQSYCLQHSRDCQHEYPKKFKQIYNRMDLEATNQVESLLMQIFFGSAGAANQSSDPQQINIMRLYNGFILNTISSASVDDSQLVYAALEQSAKAKNDPNVIYLKSIADEKRGTRFVRKDKMKGMFKKYFIEPCEYYVRKLGPDVFIPATFDAEWQHQVDYREFIYYFGWAQFKLCVYLLENERAMVQNLVKIANWA